MIRDRLQISPVLLREFKRINFYSPWNLLKTFGFLIISGRNGSYLIRLNLLVLQVKFGDDPLK